MACYTLPRTRVCFSVKVEVPSRASLRARYRRGSCLVLHLRLQGLGPACSSRLWKLPGPTSGRWRVAGEPSSLLQEVVVRYDADDMNPPGLLRRELPLREVELRRRLIPTRRGRWSRGRSFRREPGFGAGIAKRAGSVATMRSQEIARLNPPPAAAPCTAATTGWPMRARREMVACR